jgi:hypothetical protein
MKITVSEIKAAVLQATLGILALNDKELLEHLEQFWFSAYKRGCDDTIEMVQKTFKPRE